MEINDLEYQSSFDATASLRVLTAFEANGVAKPLMICMHSYGGDRIGMIPCISKTADKGFFAAAPDMRGRSTSGGKRDDGGLEIADIYDCILFLFNKYPSEIDTENVNIAGWSGGGGSVYMALTKMPDRFCCATIYYGISDYAYLARSTPSWMGQIKSHIGFVPDEANEKYLCRNAVEYISNNRFTQTYLFWDEEETLCPGEMNENYLAAAKKHNLFNIFSHKSVKGDKGRWFHGKEVHSELAEQVYEPNILKKQYKLPLIEKKGIFFVAGFLVTKFFHIFFGTGESTVSRLRYEISDKSYIFEFEHLAGCNDTEGWLRIPKTHKTLPLRVSCSGKDLPIVHRQDEPNYFYIYNVKTDGTYIIEWKV